jgi:YVTN family beta-propeller protein
MMHKVYLPIIFVLAIALAVMTTLYIKKSPESEKEMPLPESYKNLSEKYEGIGSPGLGYVPHISHDFVSVLDLKGNRVIGIIPAKKGADFVAFSPNGERGYITCFNGDALIVFNKKTNEQIEIIETGRFPDAAMVTQDNKYVLVSHESEDGLWFLDAATNEFVKKLDEGSGFPVNYKDGKLVYQAQIFIPYVYVIDLQKQEIIKKIEVGGRPMALAFTPDYKYAYIPNYDLREVEKIEVGADSVVKRIGGIKSPRGIAITPDGKFAYITNVTANNVTVIDLAADSVYKTISGFHMPTFAAVSADGKYVYVTNQGGSSVAVIDTGTNEITSTIKTADNGITITLD